MTKAELARIQGWRLKVLQQAGEGSRNVARTYLPTFRDLSASLLSLETAVQGARRGRPVGPSSEAASIASRHPAGGGRQDPLSPAALSFRPRQDRRLSQAISPGPHRGVVRAPDSASARHEPAPGQSEAPATPPAVAAYEKPQPGHRLQMDVKFLERIPGTRKRLYQFTAVDDCTRIRVLKVYDACNQRTAIRFADEVLRRLPFRVRVVQTDNGAEFQSQFHWHLETRDVRHVYIRPRTPHLNGKVERSHRVDDQEFYQLLDKNGISDDIHLFNERLREWEDYYNYQRPHAALDGQTPYERLVAKMRAGASPVS